MLFYIGQIRPFRWSEIKHISKHQDLRCVTQGDIVETFGHVFQWDEDCVPVEIYQRCHSRKVRRLCNGNLPPSF